MLCISLSDDRESGEMTVCSFMKCTVAFRSSRVPDTTITMTLASRIDNTSIPLGQQASMTILRADGGHHTDFNRNSIVVRLDLGTQRVLLMGDAEAGNRAQPTNPPATSSIERVLLDCCPSDVAANVMIVGHHGSETSSRLAFVNAVGASIFVVSSGPTKYSSVVLPDSVIISELQGLGEVFRTDVNDAACAMNPTKIGPPADGNAGGCNAVRVKIPAAGSPVVSAFPAP